MTIFNDRVELTVKDHVANVVLSRADKMNALDDKMFLALIEAAEAVAADESIRAVVISGQGKAFCAGLDMENFAAMKETGGSAMSFDLLERSKGIANDVQYAVWAWRELPVPVIAAVHGVALGGGLQIALAADMRYASSEARFSIMEMKWGIIPDMSSSQLMRHYMPDDVIRELTYTARMFGAEEAREMRVITQIVENPLEHAHVIAGEIALKNPDAIRASKWILNQANYVSAKEGLLMESQEQQKIIGSANQIEAVVAAMQKRKPNFKD